MFRNAPVRVETFCRLADWKAGVADLFTCKNTRSPAINGDGAHNVIERGSGLVDDITDQDSQFNLLRWMKRLGADGYFFSIRFEMEADPMRRIYRSCLPE
jgi:hypothetical protein